MNQLKIITASRSPIYKFENLKRTLYNCNANIYFNQQCLKGKLTPTYAKIHIPHTSPASRYTQHKVSNIRIKDEIKFLHAKKQKLNALIYRLHLELSNTWKGTWQYIYDTIEDKLQKELQIKYRTLHNKLKRLTQLQTRTPQQRHAFYPRVINNTDIPFSDNEMALLQKGPKYNLHTKNRDWIQNLALEAETAISHLPPPDRDAYRLMTAERIQKLQQKHNTPPDHSSHSEAKTIKSIRAKLRENDAMITLADKGNSLVILPTPQYESKIQDFISANDFQTRARDPMRAFQALIRKTVNNSKTLIPPDTKWKHVNMNPSAPSIKGLIKIHKQNQPIRPVVNWQQAPAYKLARLFTQKIRQLSPLPNAHNVENTKDLIRKLHDTPILPQFTLASLDISNMYTNIPISETRDIISEALAQNLRDPQTQSELMTWYDTITSQNYFVNDHRFSSRRKVLPWAHLPPA
jgi:hypothetical protein